MTVIRAYSQKGFCNCFVVGNSDRRYCIFAKSTLSYGGHIAVLWSKAENLL